jgi:uncharacterized protein YecE (DUF72 family)
MGPNSSDLKSSCQLYVGTCGYSFPEWTEAGFYPPGTPGKEMLSFYSRQFNAIEINYTWYQMPKAEAMERMLPRVSEGFVFSVKLTRTMTHEIDPQNWRSQVVKFRHGIAPLVQTRRLKAVLVQFGPSFDRTREKRLYLAHLLDELAALPVAVEFRHRSWADDKVFAGLERRRVALVVVDVPYLPHLFPTHAIVTNPDLFYVRLHGRNAIGWRSGNMQKQFDYDYTFEELQEWSWKLLPQMAERAHTGAIFFNNHVRGQAPRNARMMIEQLTGQGYFDLIYENVTINR